MNELTFKNRLGIFLVLSHFSIILLVFILYTINWYNLEQLMTTLVIIVPLFSSYTTLILGFVFRDTQPAATPVPSARATISFAIPCVFVVVLAIVLIKEGYKTTLSPEAFTMLIGAIETAFGIYIATIVKKLFDS